jgi:hypothetical protein
VPSLSCPVTMRLTVLLMPTPDSFAQNVLRGVIFSERAG